MPLRDKLAALTAPSREVDAEIAKAFKVPVTQLLCYPPIDATPKYTASLDAAVELVEREMGWDWDIERYEGEAVVTLDGIHQHGHDLPAVAMLLALVNAKEIE